jgi:aspartyl/asparaginyl-tRNA synthetase
MERIMTHLGRKESDGNSIWIRYRFLIRLIALGLMLLFILSVSTTILISRRSYHQLEVSTEETVQSIAKSIDDNLRENLKVLRQISQFCIENPSTYEKTIKNYNPEIMYKVFNILGFNNEYVESRFGGMLNAFKFGAPPHAGCAPGLDRIFMVLEDADNIRDIVAFPKNGSGIDLMMGSPSPVDDYQLEESHIEIVKEDE